MNLRDVSASEARLPLMRSTTLLAFRGVILAYFSIAFASIVLTLHRRSLLGACVPSEGPGGSKLAEFVAHYVLGDVYGNELPPVMDRKGEADKLGHDR